jgi:glycosyltransferase involved in cell wall biosynthesis
MAFTPESNQEMNISWYLDLVRFPYENCVEARGWAFAKPAADGMSGRNGADPKDDSDYKESVVFPEISVEDEEKRAVQSACHRSLRADVSGSFLPETPDFQCGFSVTWQYREGRNYRLCLRSGKTQVTRVIDIADARVREREALRHFPDKRAMKRADDPFLKADTRYMKEHWSREAFDEAIRHRFTPFDPAYTEFVRSTGISAEELNRQRAARFPEMPKISVIVPTYRTPERFLVEMIESVRNQTYQNWELCIADGSEGDRSVLRILKKYHRRDPRIRYQINERNLGISGNTNEALKMAAGDFIALLDHDDVLAPDALYEAAQAVRKTPEADLIYSDEDKFSEDVRDRFEPAFKPDFDWEYFRANNYICHLCVIRSSLLREVGDFRDEYNGAQDFDLFLRCAEKARAIVHIPKVLYHWRCHQGSTAANPESKPYAVAAGKNAVLAHLKRIGRDGVKITDVPGTVYYYREIYQISGTPAVDIVIPADPYGEEESRRTEADVRAHSSYTNFRILRALPESPEDTADYVIFLDGSARILTENWIELLLGHCQREEVGAAGGKSFFRDYRIDQAGMAVGVGGPAGRILSGQPAQTLGPNCRAVLQQRKSALSGVCMMVKKSELIRAGGVKEELRRAFWDLDLCLGIGENGKFLVYDPNVMITRKRQEEEDFSEESAAFIKRWANVLGKPDPFYSPNYSQKTADFSYRRDFD